MYRAGLRSLVSELLRQDRLIVIDEIGVTEPKTKLMKARLDELHHTLQRTSICGLGQVALAPLLSIVERFPGRDAPEDA